MHTKTLTALFGILLGIIVSEQSVYASEIAVLCVLVGVMQGMLCLYCVHRTRVQKILLVKNSSIKKEATTSFSISLFTLIICWSVAFTILRVQLTVEKNIFTCSSVCTFSAIIISSPKIQDVYQTFIVKPDTQNNVYDIQVKTALYPRVKIGENLLLTGTVIKPRVSMPHGSERVFDMKCIFVSTKLEVR